MSAPRSYVIVDSFGVGWELTESRPGEGTVYEHEHTDMRQLPKEVSNFCCQCGSKQYKPVYHERLAPDPSGIIGPGSNAGMSTSDRKVIKEYYCTGCTTKFGDPAKFSKNQPATIVNPVATVKSEPEYRRQIRESFLASFGPLKDPD